ncbi:hypothetical protein [Calycomorphotria hydatis]|uniref:Uncharacterized protein n=1 Tax=Calycomorphotria hydatis TaxID=2528027 RepID=A0A517TAT0_9PLAN|nr:hypothetical protein [Calycomorphotria hydatis]QDT65475.1 hypothetical protein V22_27290 [Calycomorphotria hydatis]
MTRACIIGLIVFPAILSSPFTTAAEEIAAQTATPNEFPQPGTAHYLAGELTLADHVNRRGILRPDRTDAQSKYQQDLPLEFSLLPYGSIYYHGASASLADIPIGTHLHAYIYRRAGINPDEERAAAGKDPLRSDLSEWSEVIRFEDDFSFYQRRGRGWKVQSIDHTQQQLKLTSVEIELNESIPLEQRDFTSESDTGLQSDVTVEFDDATRVWQGTEWLTIDALEVGQVVQLNLSECTLYGPGRCVDIWLDEESRTIAAERQRQRHIRYQKQRGLPAMVTHVEHQVGGRGHVFVRVCDGLDQSLYESMTKNTSIIASMVSSSLRPHGGGGMGIDEVTHDSNPPLGDSGLELKLHCYELLEGMRPGYTIRLQRGDWPRRETPREEWIRPRDLRPEWPLVRKEEKK